jgi:hypothetical protein
VNDELAIVRRRGKLPLKQHLGRVALQQTGFEDLDPGLALGLGRVHRHVGMMEQLLEVGLARRCGDADTGTDLRDPAADVREGRDRVNDPLRDLRGCHGAGAAQQDGELVAAQACAQVLRAGGLTKTCRDLLEPVVTCSMTEHVIHVLEIVEVDEQDGCAAR